MFYEILSNPIVILFTLAFFITIMLFLLVGKKKKTRKVSNKVIKTDKHEELLDESKVNNNKDENVDDIISKANENFDFAVDDQTSEVNEKKITKVYVRKPSEVNTYTKESQDDLKYDKMSQKAEFVRTSKNISKLLNFNKEEKPVEDDIVAENCEVCKEIASRIDHSARLSKAIKDDDFENLFRSHITEHYMVINADRHISQTILNKLFEKTNKLFENSEKKVKMPTFDENYTSLKSDRDRMKYLLNNENAEEGLPLGDHSVDGQLPIDLKNVLLADAIMKRKKKI